MDPRTAFRQIWRNRAKPALVSVHRGCWGPAPENSLTAIAEAEPIGIVEIDLQLAAGGGSVVFHDDKLDRMTVDTGPLAVRDYATLTAMPLRQGNGGPGESLSTQTIPGLADVIDTASGNSFFDFDVKHPTQVDAIAGDIARLGGRHLGSVKIDTKNSDDIMRLLDLQTRDGIMVMAKVDLTRADVGHIAELAEAGVAAAEVYFADLDGLAAACRAAGDEMAISTYTLDPFHCCGLSDTLALRDPDRVWGAILDAGVSIIMTDHPGDLIAYLDR